MVLLFKADEFATMEAAFLERYGKPTKTEETPVTSRAGAAAMNRVHRWECARATVTLSRFGVSLDRSAAFIRSTPDLRESERIRREQAAKAKKDL